MPYRLRRPSRQARHLREGERPMIPERVIGWLVAAILLVVLVILVLSVAD